MALVHGLELTAKNLSHHSIGQSCSLPPFSPSDQCQASRRLNHRYGSTFDDEPHYQAPSIRGGSSHHHDQDVTHLRSTTVVARPRLPSKIASSSIYILRVIDLTELSK